MKLLIQNGTVVRPEGSFRADLLTENGIIRRIASSIDMEADRVIDASGCLIFPGFIDTHTHLDLDLTATTTADDFDTGTKAALVGGTTTVLDFATQDRGMTMQDALDKWHKKADGKSSCNYGFHMAVSEWNDARKAEVDSMIAQGVTSFKMYMVYPAMRVDDGKIYDAIRFMKDRNCLIGVHCENFDLLNARIDELHKAGRFDPMAHPLSRPAVVEAAGVSALMRTAELADAPVWVVHLSCEASLDEVDMARGRGVEVYVETCPQYITLDRALYDAPDGEKFIMSPPLRLAHDREAIKRALGDGQIDFIGTDHCSFTMAQKALGEGDFAKVPNGGAGIQNRAELVYTYAVCPGYITVEQMAALLSENAAHIFGMFPQKGVLKEGSDADIVIFDPHAPHTISYRTNLHNCDNSPYEGVPALGGTRDVILGGELVVENGAIVKPYCGKYVFRGPSERPRQ